MGPDGIEQVDEYAESLSQWRGELAAMRPILRSAGLDEQLKWRKPCYTHAGRNIVIFQPFREMCALMFFKGALLDDPHGLLRDQGEHTRSAKRLEFRAVDEVRSSRQAILDLVAEAVRAEEEGRKVAKAPPPTPRDYPEELLAFMEADPGFREAFERLTPGRQRGYLLHFTGAKRSDTRRARIERMQDRIMEGFGLHD